MSTSSTGKLPTSITNDTISVNKIAWPVDREIPKLEWELPHGVRIVSSDDHILEAPGMYEDYIAPKYKAVAPKVWKDETGTHPESTLGESAALIKSFFEALPSEQASAIVGGNAAQLWNI